MADAAKTKRKPAGAAVLREDVTRAILRATAEVLAERGYGRLTLDEVARRAQVSRPALYRRWPSKHALTTALVADAERDAVENDTGSLRGDVTAFLAAADAGLRNPLVARIVPDLLIEAKRETELGESLTLVRDTRRARAGRIFDRAIARGELSPDTDREMALDLLAAPIYWRLAMARIPTDPGYLARLTDVTLTAIAAARMGTGSS
ncbi:TetR/AcrR family transcriptional regulator [Streptomyces sp. NPDC088725]|uniref:TetR/AcrR family transcriptional regulator n=1 Tax=Streptomyces sp. NPDC088725 TaxID=3365873 RepID=UPI0037F35309